MTAGSTEPNVFGSICLTSLNMESKLTIEPQVVLQTYKDLQSQDDFTAVWIAAAYYLKYRGKLPNKFTRERHPKSFDYFKKKIEPMLKGKSNPDCQLTEPGQEELFKLIDKSSYFDNEERSVLKDMLAMWWGRGKYSRTEMIYTQKMCFERTGVEADKFVELRKWLKAEDCLTWENRPYNDYLTSYHTFNEKRMLEVLRAEKSDPTAYKF